MRNIILRSICKVLIMALAISFISGSVLFAGDDGVLPKVNINMATAKELSKLPGIGKKKAEAIVAYRSENGKFSSVDDVKKVDGIAKKTFEKIKGYLTVEGG